MAEAGASNGSARPAVLEVRDLKKHFPVRKGLLQRAGGTVFAVDGISFSIGQGETLGLVGESGCGKSTVGRTILRLIEPTGGSIRIDGRDITHLSKTELRPYRRQMQIIFQDPFSSLDPRMSAGDIVAEPMRVHRTAAGRDVRKRVAELFERVGLRKAQMDSYPHQFSGGQRQRIGIARALALNPKLIVGDEPVSALDVSIQAQVLNLMMDLQSELGLAYLFISHNLAVVEHISHRIAVMYLGRIVEYTDKRTLFTKALHPYTESLLLAVPVPDPRVKRTKRVLQGDVPSPINPPSGCHLHQRCPHAIERCKIERPELIATGDHATACHRWAELPKVAAMAAEESPLRAVRLWAAAEALHQEIGNARSVHEGIAYERHMKPVRAILTAEAFDQAWDEGRAMSFDDAVRYALDEQAGRDS